MTDRVLVDNDVVLKMCCYDAIGDLINCVAGKTRVIHVLGVLRYVLGKAISKGQSIKNRERAADRLEQLLESVALIEPNDDELELAAEFEETAQSCGADFDVGESQLLAVMITRAAILLLTGDKRAIRAMQPIVARSSYEEQVAGRVACLEQTIMEFIRQNGARTLHPRICREPAIDKSLAICFSCASGTFDRNSIVRALGSYIRDLRNAAPNVLIGSDDLTAVIAQKDSVG